MNFKYRSTKTYGHEQGLSCCFRQWRAESHCNQLHGYALSFHFEFGADKLDDRNWVMDFGALKPLKEKLVQSFDHTLAVAMDDPDLERFRVLHELGLAKVMLFPSGVGCEMFAKHGYSLARDVVAAYEADHNHTSFRRIHVISCEVREHGANSAIYYGSK